MPSPYSQAPFGPPSVTGECSLHPASIPSPTSIHSPCPPSFSIPESQGGGGSRAAWEDVTPKPNAPLSSCSHSSLNPSLPSHPSTLRFTSYLPSNFIPLLFASHQGICVPSLPSAPLPHLHSPTSSPFLTLSLTFHPSLPPSVSLSLSLSLSLPHSFSRFMKTDQFSYSHPRMSLNRHPPTHPPALPLPLPRSPSRAIPPPPPPAPPLSESPQPVRARVCVCVCAIVCGECVHNLVSWNASGVGMGGWGGRVGCMCLLQRMRCWTRRQTLSLSSSHCLSSTFSPPLPPFLSLARSLARPPLSPFRQLSTRGPSVCRSVACVRACARDERGKVCACVLLVQLLVVSGTGQSGTGKK